MRNKNLLSVYPILVLILFIFLFCIGYAQTPSPSPSSHDKKFFDKKDDDGKTESQPPTKEAVKEKTEDPGTKDNEEVKGVEKEEPASSSKPDAINPEENKKKGIKNQRETPSIPLTKDSGVGEEQSFYYRISWQGKTAGFSKFYVGKKMSLAGESFYKIESLSQLKIGMGGINRLSFFTQMTVKAENFTPTFLLARQKLDNQELTMDCLFSSNVIAQKVSSEAGDIDTFENLEEGKSPLLMMSNLWGRVDTFMEHYVLLIKSGRTGKILVYDPVLQYKGNVEIIPGDYENIDLNGKGIRAKRFDLKDYNGNISFNIWTDHNRNILKMQEPGGGIIFEICKENIVKEFETVEGVDMWKDRVCRSNIFFPNVKELRNARMKVNLQGRGLVLENVSSPGFSQKFEPAPEGETGFQGIFTVKTEDAEIKSPMKFPIKNDIPDEVIKYLLPEMGIESNDDEIKKKAIETAWQSENVWIAAKNINTWISENIALGLSLPSAKMTILNEQGNSESKALLAIAMCRSIGIPARKAGGLIFSSGNFIPHYWFEVYVGEEGWIPLDPSSGEAQKLSASHIKLFETGEVWNLSVEVLDFSPKPAKQVTFINRELTWSPGEERSYVIKRDGNPIGEEKARISEVGFKNQREAYRLVMSSLLKADGNIPSVECQGDYWMTPQGLPLEYEKNIKSGELSEKETLFFNEKEQILTQMVSGYRGNFNREIPISRGVYLMDPHFLCQWALTGGQFPDIKLGKAYTFYVFIPDTLTTEKITASVKQFEAVEAGDKIYDCFRLDTDRGISLWIDAKNSLILKISFINQKVDMELVSREFKME